MMAWDRPGNFWGDHPHYYGYRIHNRPPHWRHISHWGIDYYFYNGVYYRPYGSYYVVCRPPFGTPLEVAINRAILHSLRFAYYCDVYRTFTRTFDYYNVIARQNLIIAQQNARLALNSTNANLAYLTASQLGLIQSYASATTNYYYQDGVFYTGHGRNFTTIVPPAGAIVASLPEDYIVVMYGGDPFYRVENTLYRQFVVDGAPYFEVLGQFPY
jgi:hypothetical protein